jgi:signal transduction histidine kinase/ActR/RegA family two-component response regulator
LLEEKNIGLSNSELIRRSTLSAVLQELAPLPLSSSVCEPEHFVQFYESDTFLLDSLIGFIGAGLSENDACIVVATKPHRDALDERLQACGIDVVAAKASGQFISLDAAETLSKFMVDDSPHHEHFRSVVESIIANAAESRTAVRVFGEMVALLWADGNSSAALSLEELWNDLHKVRTFSLFCAYPMEGFGGDMRATGLSDVCTTHSRVIPAESYTSLTNPEDRLRTIIHLQQKANLLEAEISVRKRAEGELLAAKDELELQVEDLRRLHEMSVNLNSTLDIDSVLQGVLTAALAVQGTDLGMLSLYDHSQAGLVLKVQSGFDKVLKQFERVPFGVDACSTCYDQGQRIVVEDVESDPDFEPYRDVARLVGFRACHSTPLFTHNGNIIGVLSVHFRQPHRPSERELWLIDLYARMAADIIENARLHHQVQLELEERQQLLSREQRARAEAESANRLKDEFLATVSHELRTPLNAIIGWAHMLRNGKLDEATVARALKTIERNAHSQAQLIEDILDVSRVITGKLRLNIGPVDLASSINAAIDSVQLAADAKGIQLEVMLDRSARQVMGDVNRLQQVIWNLLSNAIKFTPFGGRVQVSLEHANQDAQIRVSDSGQGISSDFLPFIFDRFRQADGTSTRRHGGLGLGLAIVRHLAELHGGTVEASSPGEGLGSTFTISLPLAVDIKQVKTRRTGTGSLRAADEASMQRRPLPSLADVKVLLVDDNQDTLLMLAAMLTECNAVVQTADSSLEGLEIMHWYKPDVVVSDLAMPDEDGYSFITKVRAIDAERGTQTPAVALTAYVRVSDRARALSAGFDMFVPKPVEQNELVTAILNLAKPGAGEPLFSPSEIM